MKFFLPLRKQKVLGLTLLELVVSVSLLAILVLIATKTFTKVYEIQDRTVDEQNIEGDLRYAMGVFTDEVRSASLHQAADSGCGGASCGGVYFCTDATGDVLYVRDKNNVCVTYNVTGNRLIVTRATNNYTITSDNVIINSLKFLPSVLSDRILIKLKATGSSDYNKSISYQTAITRTTLR